MWNSLFKDSYDEYERPSLKWILSEIVVESIMKDERLASINPYFPREQGGCIYPYFIDMRVGGGLILDTLDDMYKSMSIESFMQNSMPTAVSTKPKSGSILRRRKGERPWRKYAFYSQKSSDW